MDKEYIEKFAALTAQDIEERIRHGAAGYHRAPTFMFSPQQEVAAQQAIETSKPHSPGIVAPIGGAALGGITGAVILGSGLGAAAMKYGAGVGTILGAMAGAAAARLKEEKKAIPGIIRSMYQQNPSLVKQVRELSGKAQTADIIRERARGLNINIEKFAALTAQDIEERIRHGAAGYHRAPTFMFSPQQEVAAQQAIETSKPHSPGIVAPIGGAALGGITGAVILGSGLGAAAGTILGAMAGAASARLKEEKKAIPGIIRSMYQQNPSLVKQVRELSGKAQTADIIRERELHAQELEMAQATQIERAAQAEAEAKTNQALAGAAALSSVASSAANAYKYRSNDDMNKQAQIEAIHKHIVKEAKETTVTPHQAAIRQVFLPNPVISEDALTGDEREALSREAGALRGSVGRNIRSNWSHAGGAMLGGLAGGAPGGITRYLVAGRNSLGVRNNPKLHTAANILLGAGALAGGAYGGYRGILGSIEKRKREAAALRAR